MIKNNFISMFKGIDPLKHVTAEFGRYPSGGAHNGIDIAFPNITGTNIYPVQSGTVDRAYIWQGGTTGTASWGHHVKINHGNGLYTLYAHMLNAPNVTTGQSVTTNTLLGKADSTGNVTGPHLHFEVYEGNNRVNPRPYLTGIKVDASEGGISDEILDTNFVADGEVSEGVAIEVVSYTNSYQLNITTENVISKLYNKIRNIIGEEPEPQLLHSDFCNILMFDLFGNSYRFRPELFMQSDAQDNTELIVYGGVCDTNKVNYVINGYDTKDTSIIDESIRSQKGMADYNTKSLTVLSDGVETYFQQNKNQINETQRVFNEKNELLNQQIGLNNTQLNQANVEATYNANYAVDKAGLALGQTLVGGLVNTAAGLSFNAGLGASQFASTGFSTINSLTDYNNAKIQRDFVNDNNALREQSVTLSNIQARMSLDASIRSYNASQKDLSSQPTNVTQYGDDVCFQASNGINEIYIALEIPSKEVLINANNYIKRYGVIHQKFYDDISYLFTVRKRYNYIKCNNVEISNNNIPQTHLLSLKALLIAGARFWNYDKNDFKFLNYIDKNGD